MSIENGEHRYCSNCGGEGHSTTYHAEDPECEACERGYCEGHKQSFPCEPCGGNGLLPAEAPGQPNGLPTPRLIPVDLAKGEKHEHPEISAGKTYLAQVRGHFYSGTFARHWYGWNFRGGPWGAGLQLDAPGSNRSGWEGLWELETDAGGHNPPRG